MRAFPYLHFPKSITSAGCGPFLDFARQTMSRCARQGNWIEAKLGEPERLESVAG